MSWKTVKHDGKLDFSSFKCDEPVLNDYLFNKAVQDQKNNLCTLYFLVDENLIVGGYYVVSSGSIRRQMLPTAKARKGLPGYPLGTVHIGRLARHSNFNKMKLGEKLMYSALQNAVENSKRVAAYCVTVDAKNIRAETYYAKFGFQNLLSDPEKAGEFPKAMYLRMSDAEFILVGDKEE